MEAREIYHVLKSIVEPIHAHDDQMVEIAKWIEAEFEYKPQKQASGVNTEGKALHIDSVMPRFSVSLVYQNTTANMLRVLILRTENKHAALGEAIEYFEDETKGYALILKTVIELNEA